MAINKTVRSAQDSKFENLQVNNFRAGEHSTESGVVLASRKTEGIVTLSFAAMHWMIDGSQHMLQGESELGKLSQVTLSKLAHAALHQRAVKGEIHDEFYLQVSRADVEALRTMLEVRMAHCERERDQRNPAFNPDTYIAMKFLLLDIREWLMITAIGEFKQPEPVEEESPRVYNPVDENKELETEWSDEVKGVKFRWVPNGRTWEKLHIIKNVHKDFSEPGYYLTYEAAKAVYDNLDSSQFFIGTRTNQTCADWEINDLN